MQSIYSFDDYRDYLKCFYDYQKANTVSFSYQKFSEMAGIKSPNYLKLVLSGHRNLSVKNVHQFGKALGLSFTELQFFEALTLFNQADDSEQGEFYRKRVMQFRTQKPKSIHRTKLSTIVSQWYFPGILACLSGYDKGRSVAEVATMTGLSLAEINPVLDTLLAKKVIRKDGDAYFYDESYFISHDKKDWQLNQKKILRDHIVRSLRALDEQYQDNAKFFSHTFTIEADNYEFYIDQIKAFIEGLSAQANGEIPEKLLQLNIQIFPFAKSPLPLN